MVKRRMVWLMSMVLILSLVLAACAPEREAGNGTKDEKPDKLVVWVNDEDEQVEALKKMTQRYTEETGIKIVLDRVALPDQVDKLALAGPAGNGPDVFFQPHDPLGDIVARGLAIPLEIEEDVRSGYSETALEAFTFDGELYGAPLVVETLALYYNTDLVKNPPKTWEELVEIAEDLTNPSQDEYGFLMAPEFYYGYSLISAHGGYIFGGEPGEYNPDDIGLNNKGAVKGAASIKELYEKRLIPEALTVDVMDGLFSEGKVGMNISGPWNTAIYGGALGDRIKTAPLSKVNGKVIPTFAGVKAWLVSYYSEYPEWATDLALYLSNKESSQTYFEVSGEIPAREGAWEAVDDPIYDGFIAQIPHSVPMPNVPEMAQVWGPMDDALSFIVKEDDMQEVLDEAVDHIRQDIAAAGH
ncbi:sugar ABC transporter substrate-binding protein [Desmospora activa]|uniref:Maltodextrin-binding protein n=1 Tax=Desmospora activa DSM 45169 TaxID=1121389 RepID=A0A2T4ZD17_9BACL|nr:extracellular solute-binding protein [Desmospora activa]PTM59776.1 carbohydrate ABC transporter substrate-binding protein (CUT1 family) [Desmospora activa DSM 45169]